MSLGSGGQTLQFGILGPLAVYGLMLVAVLIVPRVLGPLLWLAGIPLRIFRNEERLARSSLARDVSRTTLTAGALVMGLANTLDFPARQAMVSDLVGRFPAYPRKNS